MAVTHFEILELPDESLVDSQVNGVAMVANSPYPISQQNLVTFDRVSEFSGKSLSVSFKWRAIDMNNNVYGPETISHVTWTPNNGLLDPSAGNVTKTITNATTEVLLDVLPLNEAVEYIEVQSVTGINNWYLDGAPIYEKQIIDIKDLLSISYTPNSSGGGDGYAVLTYKVGKGENLDPLVYTLQYDIAVSATLTLNPLTGENFYQDEFDVPPPTTYDVTEQFNLVEIDGGTPNGTANLEFTITSPYLALNSWNEVIIQINGVETQKQANETFVLPVTLDLLGAAVVKVTNIIVENVAGPYTGDIDVVLQDIDGDAGLVNGANDTIEILTNYP